MTENTQTEDHVGTLRQVVRDHSAETMTSTFTKAQLIAMCAVVSIEPEAKVTKANLVEQIRAKFPAPDPALRGNSSATNPVAAMWALAHNTFANAGENKPRRKDIVQAGVDAGIAYFTSRTQYQSWFKFTNGGENMITAVSTGLPKGLLELLGFETQEQVTQADAG